VSRTARLFGSKTSIGSVKTSTGHLAQSEFPDESSAGGVGGSGHFSDEEYSNRYRRRAWINYANTAGFNEVGYNDEDAVSGFGWNNILGDRWRHSAKGLRNQPRSWAGYNFSQKPGFPTSTRSSTPQRPPVVQHHAHCRPSPSRWVRPISPSPTITHSRTQSPAHGFRRWVPMPGNKRGQARMAENSVTFGFCQELLKAGIARI